MSKKLSDRVQEAIDWIASEYKFLQDLHYRLSILSKFYIAKLALIHRTSDEQRRKQLQKELVQEANLHKSLVVARYIGKAERRANRPIHDILKALHEVHDSNIERIAREVDIPNKLLLKDTSIYFGTLHKHLKRLNRSVNLEAKYPDRSTEAKIQQELKELETEVGALETSAATLEAGLKKIKERMPIVDLSRRRALGKFALGAGTVVAAGIGLPRSARAQEVPYEEWEDIFGKSPATITEDGFLTSPRFQKGGDNFNFIRHGFSAFEFIGGKGGLIVGPVNGVFDLRSVEPFQHNPELGLVHFTYTDIWIHWALRLARQLSTLDTLKVIAHFKNTYEGNPESRKGPFAMNLKFKLPTGGRLLDIEVQFNINIHKKGFFEEKDSCTYDILINHYNHEEFIEEVFIKAREKGCSNKPYVIMGSAKNYKEEDLTKYSEHHIQLPGDYCEGTTHAIVHFLGREKPKEEGKEEKK
ncbi:hypothetical protein HYT52_01090 [Candidatus Woesearchaeota archaeon]|nr:hypothetical protein [Candidatus Woesearchaeota archaeon]